MAFDRQTDKKRRADKAAALLTLAKESGPAKGPCLSDEQLAAMVDGRIGDDQLPKFRDHLSSCGRCYEEWLLLTRLKARDATRGRLVRLKLVKKFSYIGSALAVAASIAVYLNIARFEEPAGDLSLPGSIVIERLNEAPSPALPLVEEDKAVEKAVITPKKMIKQDRDALPAAPRAVDSAAKQESSIAGAPQDIDESALWLEQIHEACLAGRQEPEFWSEIRARGEQVLARYSALPMTPEKNQIEAVLRLLPNIAGGDSVARQCRQIQDELAKDGRSR